MKNLLLILAVCLALGACADYAVAGGCGYGGGGGYGYYGGGGGWGGAVTCRALGKGYLNTDHNAMTARTTDRAIKGTITVTLYHLPLRLKKAIRRLRASRDR